MHKMHSFLPSATTSYAGRWQQLKMTDYSKIYDTILKVSQEYRAGIIERTIIIEALISESLIDITSQEKTRKSIEKYLFSDTLTLEIKVNLFTSMNKAKAFKIETPNPNLNSDLKYLQKLRNYLAHSLLDTSNEFMDIYDYTFIRYKSFTHKGHFDIDIYYKDKEEDEKNRIYNSMEIVKKINRTQESLKEIQRNLKGGK